MIQLSAPTCLSRVLCLLLILASAGCGIVHKQPIQQGNFLETEDVEQLTEGMTKRQVMMLLGTPSVQSPFHEDRWDYITTFKGRRAKVNRRQLTLLFEEGRLVNIEGDYLDQTELSEQAVRDIRELEAEQAMEKPVL